MKKLILLYLMILLIVNVSAIVINEVEMNPKEGGDGKEWLELYNEKDEIIDISGWEIWEGIYGTSGPKRILSIPNETIILGKKFYVIEWTGTKLNNGGDFVILYDNQKDKIDETKTLDETSPSIKTWQLCDNSWEFLEATKEEKNNCEIEEETSKDVEEEQAIEEEDIEEYVDVKDENSFVEGGGEKGGQIQTLTPKVISLTPKDIKSEDNIESLDKTDYAKYGFIAFCILIGVLLILKNKRKQKHGIV